MSLHISFNLPFTYDLDTWRNSVYGMVHLISYIPEAT